MLFNRHNNTDTLISQGKTLRYQITLPEPHQLREYINKAESYILQSIFFFFRILKSNQINHFKFTSDTSEKTRKNPPEGERCNK